MMRVAGRGDDGFPKAIKTDDKGNLGTFPHIESSEAIPTTVVAPNTWVYSDWIDASNFSKAAIIGGASTAVPIEVYAEFSYDGNNPDISGFVYDITTNNAGRLPIETPSFIDCPLPYLRVRIRHQDASERSLRAKVRLFNDTVDYKTTQKISNATLQEPFSGDKNVKHTFSKRMTGFFITNDGDSPLTFTIQGFTISLLAGETFRESFDPFTVVDIRTTVPYRAWGLS